MPELPFLFNKVQQLREAIQQLTLTKSELFPAAGSNPQILEIQKLSLICSSLPQEIEILKTEKPGTRVVPATGLMV